MTIPRSYRVSTEKGWRSVLLGTSTASTCGGWKNWSQENTTLVYQHFELEWHDLGREWRLSSWFPDGKSCERRNASIARRVAFILKKCTGCTFPQFNDGDLMSNLMEMESGRVFNSQKESLGSILREGARLSAQKQTTRNAKDKRRSSEAHWMPAFFQAWIESVLSYHPVR